MENEGGDQICPHLPKNFQLQVNKLTYKHKNTLNYNTFLVCQNPLKLTYTNVGIQKFPTEKPRTHGGCVRSGRGGARLTQGRGIGRKASGECTINHICFQILLRHIQSVLQLSRLCARSCRRVKMHKTCVENAEIIKMFSASEGLCPPDPLTRGFAPGPH
jgi:hypothetical protein